MVYSLTKDGDDIEKQAYKDFLKDDFPAYENFWQKFVVPLTGRPDNIFFKSDLELQNTFQNEKLIALHERICIAQLHYSVFVCLYDAHLSSRSAGKSLQELTRLFSNLYSALDISAELFARYERFFKKDPISVDAFDKDALSQEKSLRCEWQRKDPYPENIKDIREYRNALIHGRLTFCSVMPSSKNLSVPELGCQRYFLDWREAMKLQGTGDLGGRIWAKNLAEDVFKTVVKFLQGEWSKNLTR